MSHPHSSPALPRGDADPPASAGRRQHLVAYGVMGLGAALVVGLSLGASAKDAILPARGALWSQRPAGSPPLAEVPDFRALASQALPAVVSIQVEQKVRLRGGGPRGGPGGADPFDFFHRYFGGEMPREYHNRGLGSGFVIDASGLVLTNHHVIEDADSIEVTFDNGKGDERKVVAKVLGSAPRYDVAVLRCEDVESAPFVFLGDSDTTQIGDWVMAVGNPFGLTHSVSTGIISARERRDVLPSGRAGLYNFLQTDASINPGNSGGPLINMRGEVIGINSAINAAGAGIGFAIPINMVKEMLPDLVQKGRFARSWLGIKIQPLSQELAQSFGLKKAAGALVAEVVAGGPAAQARLREGDVVLQFDGREVRQFSDLPLFASMAGVGKTVPVVIWREGKTLNVSVRLTESPEEDEGEPQAAAAGPAGEWGLRVAEISPRLQAEMRLEASEGAVVRAIEPGGVADRGGLRPGDVILQVGGAATPHARDVVERLRAQRRGSLVRIKVSRGGSSVFLALRRP